MVLLVKGTVRDLDCVSSKPQLTYSACTPWLHTSAPSQLHHADVGLLTGCSKSGLGDLVMVRLGAMVEVFCSEGCDVQLTIVHGLTCNF